MAAIRTHAVRFEEIDAAGLVFFARFFFWCHESMERFFDPIPGGYVDLITRRRVGFPAVHAESDWKSPLRYGDATCIETSVANIGTTSVTFRFVFTNEKTGAHVATIHQVVTCVDLDTVKKQPLPADCRALLEAHRSA
jgi:4-hydroxybenzoyl-CoA thioesterase